MTAGIRTIFMKNTRKTSVRTAALWEKEKIRAEHPGYLLAGAYHGERGGRLINMCAMLATTPEPR
jgi:hypothetical protein